MAKKYQYTKVATLADVKVDDIQVNDASIIDENKIAHLDNFATTEELAKVDEKIVTGASESGEGGFELADEEGNVALRITENGDLITKNFDSSMINSEFIAFVNDYMATSTLPSIQVPKITNAQLDQIITAKTQGKLVLISTEDGTHDVVETCLLEGQQSFKIFYCNYLIEYIDNGDSVVAEYIALNFHAN